MIVVGVDPGGRNTGVVVRDGQHCSHGVVVTRRGDGVFPDAEYLTQVCEAVAEAITIAGMEAVVAIEGVVNPNPHMGLSNPGGIIAAAMVLGAVLTRWPEAVVVRPGGHGSGAIELYPPTLVGARERNGAGKMRHARSAWDIAGVGAVVARCAVGVGEDLSAVVPDTGRVAQAGGARNSRRKRSKARA